MVSPSDPIKRERERTAKMRTHFVEGIRMRVQEGFNLWYAPRDDGGVMGLRAGHRENGGETKLSRPIALMPGCSRRLKMLSLDALEE